MTTKDWLIVAVIAFAGGFLGTVFTTVAPVLPLIAAHYGGGREGAFVAEWLLAMPSIGIVVGGPVSGWFVERFGARMVLLVCFGVFGLAGLSGMFIENSSLLLASRFVVGITAVGQATAATVVAGDRFVGPRRSFVLGIQVALAAALGIGTTLAAGALAERAGWRAPFGLYGLAILTVILAALVVDRRPLENVRARAGMGSLLPMLPIFFVITVTMMVSFIPSNQVPLLLAEQGSGNPTVLSVLLGGSTLATVVGALLYSRLRAKLGAARTGMVGGVLQGVAILLLAVTESVYPIGLSLLILGLGGGILYPGFSHIILDRAPEAARGRAIGLLFTAQFTGPFLSTALVVPAIAAFGRYDSLLTIGLALLIAWIAYASWRSSGSRQPVPHAVALPTKDIS
jgi:MFS family permease